MITSNISLCLTKGEIYVNIYVIDYVILGEKMDKKTELELLRRYAEIRRLYEQTNTLSVLMDEL